MTDSIKYNIIYYFFVLFTFFQSESAFSNEQIIGEKLFNSFIDSSFHGTCVSCHATSISDTFSFYPDIYDLANKTPALSQEELNSKLNEPYMHSSLLSEMHENIDLSNDSTASLFLYIQSFHGKARPVKKSFNYNWMFIVSGVFLIVLAFILKFKWLKFFLILLGIGFSTTGILDCIQKLNYTKGYQPPQVLKFSHKTHTGDNKINCLYCHSSADNSAVAGIPSQQLCINCHLVIREGQKTGAFELNKLLAAWDSAQSMEWVRVHQLPAYVRFSHENHLKNGKTACADCHGKVEEMHEVKQLSDLSMRWCLECHVERQVGEARIVWEVEESIFTGKCDTTHIMWSTKSECIICHH